MCADCTTSRGLLPCAEHLEPRLLLSGTSYLVTSLADTVTSDGVVTLREAIEAANDNSAITDDVLAGSADEMDIITFDQAALSLEAGVAVGAPLKITLAGEQLEITDDLTITGLGADVLSIDANGQSRVFYISGDETEAELTGLTITGGLTYDGGGICNWEATLTLTNMAVSGNTVSDDGGGIHNYRGDVTLTNSSVSDNTASGDRWVCGGGICNEEGTVTLKASTVSGNTATAGSYIRGGGICNDKGTVTLTDSTVSNNFAAGDSFIFGGGIYNAEGSLILVDTTILKNRATGGSQAHYTRPVGGGIYNKDGALTLMNTMIAGNHSEYKGGGIYNVNPVDGGVILTHCAVVGNWADYIGGGIWNEQGSLEFTNCTVTSNSAVSGGGGISSWNDRVDMNNTIIALNTASEYENIGSRFATTRSTLVNVDPGFVRNPSAGLDGLWGTADDDYGDLRLTYASLAINMGDNALAVDGEGSTLTTDLAGDARIMSRHVDIGAYEYQGPFLASWESPSAIVTTLSDIVDTTDGLISLREATVYSASLGQDITFAPGLSEGVILLAAGELSICHSMTIDAAPVGGITIDVAGQDQVIHVVNSNAKVSLSGLTVDGNSDGQPGRGIFNMGILAMDHCTVTGNAAGGIESYGDMALTNCMVSDGNGHSAIRIVRGTAVITNCAITNNGGGVGNIWGTVFLTNCIVSGNDGTGIGNNNGDMTLTNCVVAGNGDGGIYSSDEAYVTLINSVVANNGGTGISHRDGELTLTNCTVAGNRWRGISASFLDAGVELNNSIVALNTGPVEDPNISGDFSATASIVAVAPGFVRNPSAGVDGVWGTADDDYGDLRLAGTSIAINTGNDELAVDSEGVPLAVDLDGNPRPADGHVDIGAYEYQGAPSILREAPSGVITTLVDVVDSSDQQVSLREACVYGGLLGEDVTFAADLSGGTVTLAGEELCVYLPLAVDATSVGGITIDAAGQSRVMTVAGGPLSLTGLVLTGGTTGSSGGGIRKLSGELVMADCTVSGNSSGLEGGGINSDEGNLALTNCSVTCNISNQDGGGIFSNTSLVLLNSMVSGNTAGDRGGGIYRNRDGVITLTNSTVSGNTAGGRGGGIYYDDDDGSLTLTNSTVSGNSAEYGGGIWNNDRGELALNNTIVALNDGLSPQSGDIFGYHLTSNSIIGGAPGFVRNPSAGADGVWGTADDDLGDLHLLPTSAAVDAGDNALAVDADGLPLTTDLGGKGRVYGGTVDIGAYEYALGGDADYDGDVDLADFITLKTNFGPGTTWARGDFDGNGSTDMEDFIMLKANFTGGVSSNPTRESDSSQAAAASSKITVQSVQEPQEAVAVRIATSSVSQPATSVSQPTTALPATPVGKIPSNAAISVSVGHYVPDSLVPPAPAFALSSARWADSGDDALTRQQIFDPEGIFDVLALSPLEGGA